MKNKSAKNGSGSFRKGKEEKKEKIKREDRFFERWKNPASNSMGNNILGEIKIANSEGRLEGGDDKRWHMKEEE